MFLDLLLMGDVTVLVPFNFVHSVAQTSRKTLLSFESPFNSLCVAVLHFFASGQKYHHFDFLMFFKGVAIFHPLHPGATPWYFASNGYMLSRDLFPSSWWGICYSTFRFTLNYPPNIAIGTCNSPLWILCILISSHPCCSKLNWWNWWIDTHVCYCHYPSGVVGIFPVLAYMTFMACLSWWGGR